MLRVDFDFIFVNHYAQVSYRYPLIQYKRVQNELIILGINDYSKIIFERLSNLKEITLPKYKIPITSIEFSNITHQVTDETVKYEFQTPWIALNSENFNKFKIINSELKYRFLENIMVGNFLSALKGMGIIIHHKLYASIKRLSPKYAIVHQNPFCSFYAQFTTNLNLPDLIGIGNSVSKGFGVIKKT